MHYRGVRLSRSLNNFSVELMVPHYNPNIGEPSHGNIQSYIRSFTDNVEKLNNEPTSPLKISLK